MLTYRFQLQTFSWALCFQTLLGNNNGKNKDDDYDDNNNYNSNKTHFLGLQSKFAKVRARRDAKWIHYFNWCAESNVRNVEFLSACWQVFKLKAGRL
jgi:hypothetical protein